MHAILGLAASELMRDDPSLVTAAMEHRVKAIRADVEQRVRDGLLTPALAAQEILKLVY